MPHHELKPSFVGTTTCMLEESASTSKNPPLINVNEKSTNCSTSTSYSAFSST
jgi:hypothetical protein